MNRPFPLVGIINSSIRVPLARRSASTSSRSSACSRSPPRLRLRGAATRAAPAPARSPRVPPLLRIAGAFRDRVLQSCRIRIDGPRAGLRSRETRGEVRQHAVHVEADAKEREGSLECWVLMNAEVKWKLLSAGMTGDSFRHRGSWYSGRCIGAGFDQHQRGILVGQATIRTAVAILIEFGRLRHRPRNAPTCAGLPSSLVSSSTRRSGPVLSGPELMS